MPRFAELDDVRGRLSYGRIEDESGTPGDPGYVQASEPNATTVEGWLDQLSAAVRMVFAPMGLPTSVTAGTDAALFLTDAIANVVAARVREAWATARGDANEDGQAADQRFQAWLEDVRKKPAYWGEFFGGGSAPTESIGIASHTTLNFDGLSSTDDSFAPTFKRGQENF